MTRAAHTTPLAIHGLEDVFAAVRERGGRVSLPRRVLLDALFAADAPVTAESLAGDLQLGVGSVYRNLEYLEGLGVVRHFHLGHRAGLYVLAGRAAQEYLVCEACERVVAVAPAQLDGVRRVVREALDFEASFDHFPMFGRCADCRTKAERAREPIRIPLQ